MNLICSEFCSTRDFFLRKVVGKCGHNVCAFSAPQDLWLKRQFPVLQARHAVLEVVYFQDFVILQCSIVHGLFIHIYGRHNGMLNNYKIVLKLYIKETDTIDFIEYV